IATAEEVSHLAISPDGSMLAFVGADQATGESMLFVQPIGSPAATRLEGTEGASYPFWSPDNAYVGFFAGAKLKKAPTSGGLPQVLANVQLPRGGTWSTKNVIVYAPGGSGVL